MTADQFNPANNSNYLTTLLDQMETDPLVETMVHSLFRRGDLSFLLHDTQRKIRDTVINTPEKEILILCSRQLGKSFVTICAAIEHAVRNPGSIVRIFSNTESQVIDIINDNLRVIEQLAPAGFIDRKKSDKRWYIGGTGDPKEITSALSQIRIGPLARAHIDGKRGGNASLIILEEGGFTPSEDYKSAIGSVIGPQLLRSRGKLIHVTTSSEDPDHYIHAVVAPKCEVLGTLLEFTIYDNPQLLPDQIEEAKARCVSNEQWEREYLCKVIRSLTSSIIPEFNDSHINAMTPPSHANYRVSIDFGGTVDKHALILYYYDFERAKICIYDERMLDKNSSTEAIKQASIEMESGVKWLTDYRTRIADAPGQIRVDLNTQGFTMRTPEKGQGSLEAGINMTRMLFANSEIEVHPRCKHTIAVMRYGRYTQNRKDFVRTEAMGHCDMLMAVVYGVRHIDKSNPFPRYLGLNKRDHYINDKGHIETVKSILTGFFK